jgi:ABC-type dipeptide/oligopeptide/nickel transport system permease subunit
LSPELPQGVLTLAPWVSLFPGAFIMLAVLALNVRGDGLRDALDPRAEMRWPG